MSKWDKKSERSDSENDPKRKSEVVGAISGDDSKPTNPVIEDTVSVGNGSNFRFGETNRKDCDRWFLFRWFPCLEFLNSQYFRVSLMRYDEYAVERFTSLLMDYYTLRVYDEIQQEKPRSELKDGPDPNASDSSRADPPVVDKMLEGYRQTAMRIVGKYVENDAQVRAMQEIPKLKRCGSPRIQEVVLFEKCIFRFLPEVEMSLRSITIEHKYSHVVGNAVYQKIKAGFHSTEDNNPASILARRTEIDYMLQTICESYTDATHRDQYRFRIWAISFATLISTYGLVLLFLFLWWAVVYWPNPGTVDYWNYVSWLAVPFMGSLGAFISVQYRNEKLPIHGDVMRTALRLNSGLLGVCFRIWIGAVFAILLNLFFVANFMNDVVPKEYLMDQQDPTAAKRGLHHAFRFLFELDLLSSLQVAKILCWSLVAGFAERLLPDQLSRLTERLESRDIRMADKAVLPQILSLDEKSKKKETAAPPAAAPATPAAPAAPPAAAPATPAAPAAPPAAAPATTAANPAKPPGTV